MLLILPFIPAFGLGYFRVFDILCLSIVFRSTLFHLLYDHLPRVVIITALYSPFFSYIIFVGGSLSVTLGVPKSPIFAIWLLASIGLFHAHPYTRISPVFLGKSSYLDNIYFSRYPSGFASRSDVEWLSALSAAPTAFFGDTTYNILGL